MARVSQMAEMDAWLNTPRIDQQYDQHLSSRLDGTCDWIFDHSQFKAWQSEDATNSKARMLWICGPPGFGKSVLCARIVQKLQQDNRPLAYTFCSTFVQAGMKPEAIGRWWIHQLIHLDESAFDMVWKHIVHGAPPVTSAADVFAILRAVLAATPDCTLVVDGLDEFGQSSDTALELENHRGEMLRHLRDAIAGSKTKVLVVSRQDIRPELSSVMRETDDPALFMCPITSEEVRSDVEKFSTHVVQMKLSAKQPPLRLELAESLVEKSGGMFLWIKLQERFLQDYKSPKQLRKAVSSMPNRLHHTFERSWKGIQALSDSEDQQRAVAILRWATFAFEPLKVLQLAEALVVEQDPGMDDFNIPTVGGTYEDEGIVRLCGSLIEIRESEHSRTVQLVHASVKEYITSSELHQETSLPASLNFSNATAQHRTISEICLQCLNCEEIWRCCEADSCPEQHFLIYATGNWWKHILRSGIEDFYALPSLRCFFQGGNPCFQRWAEHFERLVFQETIHNFEDNMASTPLYYATILDLLPGMPSFQSDAIASINSTNGIHMSALQACCIEGNQASFDCLLDWGADANAISGEHGSPLIAAASLGHTKMVSQLLNGGANVNFETSESQRRSRTALLAATRQSHIETIKVLLDAGANISIPCRVETMGQPLHWAAENGDTEIAKLLLDHGADPVAKDAYGGTPMYVAALVSFGFEVCKHLASTYPNSQHFSPGWNGETPLHAAARRGEPENLQILLGLEPELEARDEDDITPCFRAAVEGNLECVRLLLDNGADHSAPKSGGFVPIHSASAMGHVQVVALLLDRGAGCNATGTYSSDRQSGVTPLDLAAKFGHLEVIELLLRRGANVCSATSGLTPLDFAVHLGQAEATKALLDHGAKSGLQLKVGKTAKEPEHPLFPVGSLKSERSIDVLLQRGIPPSSFIWCEEFECLTNKVASSGNLQLLQIVIGDRSAAEISPDAQGRTALHSAALGGSLEVFEFLLKRRFDIDARDKTRQTLLHYAAASSSLDVLERVLKLPNIAELNASGAKWTPLHWAARNGTTEMINVLLKAGVQETFVESPDPPEFFSPWALAHFWGNTKILGNDTGFVLQSRDPKSTALSRNRQDGSFCDSCSIVSKEMKT